MQRSWARPTAPSASPPRRSRCGRRRRRPPRPAAGSPGRRRFGPRPGSPARSAKLATGCRLGQRSGRQSRVGGEQQASASAPGAQSPPAPARLRACVLHPQVGQLRLDVRARTAAAPRGGRATLSRGGLRPGARARPPPSRAPPAARRRRRAAPAPPGPSGQLDDALHRRAVPALELGERRQPLPRPSPAGPDRPPARRGRRAARSAASCSRSRRRAARRASAASRGSISLDAAHQLRGAGRLAAARPSPSSGVEQLDASPAAARSSSRWRSRSRSAESRSRSPGAAPAASTPLDQILQLRRAGARRRACLAASLERRPAPPAARPRRRPSPAAARRGRRGRPAAPAAGPGGPAAGPRAGTRSRAAARRSPRGRRGRSCRPHTSARLRPAATAAGRPPASPRPRGEAPPPRPAPVVRTAPRARANSASTYVSSPCGPTISAAGWPPAIRPIAWASIVLPAPVSPVSTSGPETSSSSACSISARFSMRRRSSMQPENVSR